MHWAIVFIIATIFFKITQDKSINTLFKANMIIIILTVVIIAENIFFKRGTALEILSLKVAHRSSAYLVFHFGVSFGITLRLLIKKINKEK